MQWKNQAQRHKRRIIIAAAAVSMVVLVLGLGLGLGLQLQRCRDNAIPHTTCRNRCYQPYDDEVPGCRCDAACSATGSCCLDFHDVCTAPTQQWECTKLRCGETRRTDSKCLCSDDCMSAGDCCTNYQHVCHGQQQWVEGQCEDTSSPTCPPDFQTQPLLLVSLDGFRAEYLQTWSGLVPVLDKLRTCGTSAPYMQAAFPSKTFPNHYTIVTGLYPESNGLVDNLMYDPVMDATFSLSSPEKENPAWYLGQPVWHTAQYQGLKSGTFFWPGSDVKINGTFPNIYQPYDGKVPFEERVFTILKWLQLPAAERPDFYTLYLEEPDKSGHSFGPVSGGIITSIQAVDQIIGQLMNGLKQLGLQNCVNIVIVADHGMEEMSCDRKETLQDFVGDTSQYFVIEGPFGRIRARDKDTIVDSAALVANMTCHKADQKIKAYLKAHLPKRLHFASSRRIEDVNVLVEPKWLFQRSPGSLTFCSGGNHGYDNDVESMHAMFLSYGPKFQSRTEVEPFSNVELYNLMCDALKISPAENNGTHGSLNHILRNPPFSPTAPEEQSAPEHCPLLSLVPDQELGCSCPGLDEKLANSRLNLSSEEVSAVEKRHSPLGRPRMLQQHHSYCVLHHQGFVSGYSHRVLMPLWSSFTVDKPSDLEPLPAPPADCLRADVRINATRSQRCEDYNGTSGTVPAFLYPPSLNSTAEQQSDALTMSNVVPMFPEFKKIWDFFQKTLLKKYAFVYNGVTVVTGPVFDWDHDGRFDENQNQQAIPIPTHYFVVLTSCADSDRPPAGCEGELQTVSFLLPHRESNAESCMSSADESVWVEERMWFHQARVRDVEWITGLDFFQDSGRPITELLRLKTRPTAAIRLKQL